METAKKRFILSATFCFMLSIPLFPENKVFFRFMPLVNAPAGIEYFEPGFGGRAFLDYSFVSLPQKFNFGLSLGGGYSRLSVKDNSVFSILEGDAGPFIDRQFLDRFSLRLGLGAGVYRYQWNGRKNIRPKLDASFQALFHVSPFLSLFAGAGYTWYTFADALPINSVKAGLGVSLNLGELVQPLPRVSAEKTGQRRIFPVSYAWYEDNEIARVKISNNEPNAITSVELSFYLERYMNQPTLFAAVPRLGPGESAEFPVTALFNESLLELLENINANSVVSVGYRSLGMKKEANIPMPMPVYHRNAFSWDDDRRAASFVSPGDPGAVYFARFVEAAVRKSVNSDTRLPKNMLLAVALFEALDLYGINYLVDPASSYVELSENASSLDNLNYPYQTLMYRGGDCDDLSILFCSLLEALGIKTAFITTPGHIYAAFDSGITVEEPGTAGTGFIYAGGTYWLPVEITASGEGFAEAWRLGSQEWNDADGEGVLYPMGDSWLLYQPVSAPGAGENLPAMPEETEIARRFEASVRTITGVYYAKK
ncbi:MAG: hypothetical protein LBC62_10020 [Treponema sp.]|jgi:hypothetical protein|nr:hypothetical protein [Treponema sp.]